MNSLQPPTDKTAAKTRASIAQLQRAKKRAQSRDTWRARRTTPTPTPVPVLWRAWAVRGRAALGRAAALLRRLRAHPKRAYLGAFVALLLSLVVVGPDARLAALGLGWALWARYEPRSVGLGRWWWPKDLRPTLARALRVEAVARGYGRSPFSPAVALATALSRAALAGLWAWAEVADLMTDGLGGGRLSMAPLLGFLDLGEDEDRPTHTACLAVAGVVGLGLGFYAAGAALVPRRSLCALALRGIRWGLAVQALTLGARAARLLLAAAWGPAAGWAFATLTILAALGFGLRWARQSGRGPLAALLTWPLAPRRPESCAPAPLLGTLWGAAPALAALWAGVGVGAHAGLHEAAALLPALGLPDPAAAAAAAVERAYATWARA